MEDAMRILLDRLFCCWLIGFLSVPCADRAFGACQIIGTTFDGGSIISCTGSTPGGLATGDLGDVVTVEPGASVDRTLEQTSAAAAAATSVAVDMGGGTNQVTNNGIISSSADADATPQDQTASSSSADATGILAGAGEDKLENNGPITVEAQATATSGELVFNAAGNSSVSAGTEASAVATGFSPGAGKYTFLNGDVITVSATAESRGGDCEFQLIDKASVDAGISALASSYGFIGQDAGSSSPLLLNTITNTGSIITTSSATASNDEFRTNLMDWSVADTSATAESDTMGIKAGAGTNSITNQGTVDAAATARSEVWKTEVNISDWGLASSGLSVDATATAMEGNSDTDTIVNSGTFKAAATAEALKVDVNGTLVDLTIGPGFWETLLFTSAGSVDTLVTATASGVSLLEGNDALTNTGTIDVLATARLNKTAVAVGAEGIPKSIIDILQGKSLSSSAATAEANATGINGGSGADTITNQGLFKISAVADGGDISVNLSLPILEPIMPFPSPSFALGGSGVTAKATAAGIKGEDGDDVIKLAAGQADVDASATTSGVIVSGALQGVFGTINLFDMQAAVADIALVSEATATGLDGGSGNDSVFVAAPATLAVDGTASAESVDVAVGIQGKINGALSAGAAMSRADTSAVATATGIEGGAGDDTVDHYGSAAVVADATAASTVVDADVQLSVKKSLSGGAAIASVRTEAEAVATGIGGGGEDDTLTNSASFGTSANADADSVTVTAVVQNAEESLAVGLSYVDAETTATATAVGLDGGSGDDGLTNAATGILTATADAESTSVGVGLTVSGSFSQEWTAVAGGAVTDGTTNATSDATGMSGGVGADTLSTAGTVTGSALANADSTSVSVDLTGVKDGLTLGFTYADNATTATASACGLDGGDGDDRLTNTGSINVDSTPEATSASVSATITGATKGTGITGGAALTDGTTAATATATGMAGGVGDDVILNLSSIDVDATPDADAASVAVTLGAAGGEIGLVGGFSYADAATTATATAVGIDGGAGDDAITSAGEVTVSAIPTASSASVGVTAAGVKGMGAAVGVALADGTTRTIATGTGIASGAGNDSVINLARLSVEARPDTDSASVTVGIAAAKEGVAVAGSFADATTSSQATATGIDGGSGDDDLTNAAVVEVTAEAESSSASVGVTATGTMTGVAASVSLADATTSATANATGMNAGTGADNLANSGSVTTTATADIAGASVTVNLGAAETGLVAGVAAADASITASAMATGLDGGAEGDTLDNTGSLTTTATADLSAASVSVNAGFAVNGLAAGAALADGEAAVTAAARGLGGGTGDDTLTNSGGNTVTANASVNAASVSVNLEGTTAGLAAGASLVDGDNRASASAVGIDGGVGDDTLRNNYLTHAIAFTDSTRTSVSVSGTFALEGVAAGASFADASNTAGASATGVAGGVGDDQLFNTAGLQADATTTATTTGVSVGVNISGSFVSAGASFASAETTGTAAAAGMAGDAGDDWLENQGSGLISGKAETTAKGTVVSVNISLASFSDADLATTALADYAGLTGGAGEDTLINRGGVDIDAVSHGLGQAAAANLEGYGGADVSVTSIATATGLDGGDAADLLFNFDTIDPTATATATGRSVSANLLGAVFANAGITAQATTTGMSGGAGDDQASNSGTITLAGSADVDMTGVSVNLGGYSDADGSVLSELRLNGLDGGAGDDVLINEAGGRIVTARSSLSTPAALVPTAKAETVAVGVNLLGAGNADGSSTTTATVFGMVGGGGMDSVVNRGTVDLGAVSSNLGQAGSGTLGGYGEADVSLLAVTNVTGLSGGDGDDWLTNENTVLTASTATAKGVSVTAELAGAGFTASGTTANARSIGLSGDGGADRLDNNKTIQLGATANVDQTGVSVNLAGYADADGSVLAEGAIVGLDGGEGDDVLFNNSTGSITGTATATAETVAVGVNLAGAVNADGTSTSTASAHGLFGDAGGDILTNLGTIDIDAFSTNTGQSGSGTLAGYGESDVSVTAQAAVTGLDGGGGDDWLYNYALIDLSSTATAKGVSVTAELAGAGFAAANTTGRTSVTGLSGGGGEDWLENHGNIRLTSQSKVDQQSVSVSLLGYADGSGESLASATLFGMDGDDGNDMLLNGTDGSIAIADYGIGTASRTATASGIAGAVTVNLAGATSASGNTSASTSAFGMAGGGGDDTVQNAGAISIDISSDIQASATAVQLFGSGNCNADGSSSTAITGLSGGEGSNILSNLSGGALNLTSIATGAASSYDIQLAGGGSASVGTEAVATVYGMQAGSGADILTNLGSIDLLASSSLISDSVSLKFAGSSSADSNSTATSAAAGMDGGNGLNSIVNGEAAELNVDALAFASSKNGMKTFAGTIEANGNSTAEATATGILGGEAADSIVNRSVGVPIGLEFEKGIQVQANAIASTTTDAALFAGHPVSTSISQATTAAVGIDSGGGGNYIANEGLLLAGSYAKTASYAEADTDFMETVSVAESASDATASGIKVDDGDNTVINGEQGVIDVDSVSENRSMTITITLPFLYDFPIEIPIESVAAYAVSDEHATAMADFTSNAVGIQAGNGNNIITNLGTVTVNAESTPDSHALASSNESTANALAKSGGSASASGIAAGDGNNSIRSDGILSVSATTTGTALADYTSTHLDLAEAYAGAGGYQLTSSATGISAGDGVNEVESRGTLTVTSSVSADAEGHSNTNWAKNRGNAFAGGSSVAMGISLGSGKNLVTVHDSLTVTAMAVASARGLGEDYATASAGSSASATGITMGDGGSSAVNYGTIDVSATATATATVSVGKDSSVAASADAVGIQTGGGDDLVIQYGTITTTQTANGATSSGTAITTAGGNDTVVLGAGSTTTGTIDLGTGDDTLMFLGTATVNGAIAPGAGSNTLVFDGAGTLGYSFAGFENAVKQGAGRFTLAELPTMQRLEISQGVLQVNTDYQFSSGGSFQTVVNGDGSFGQFAVNGSTQLAGDLSVLKGPGIYLNGTTYEIVETTGGTVSGSFDSVSLPASKPLLSFALNQSSNVVELEVIAPKVTTVATNPVEYAMAEYLDRIMPLATGDLATVLGEFQGLESSQLSPAITSMNSGSYTSLSKVSMTGIGLFLGDLKQRMGKLRLNMMNADSGSGTKPILLAYSGSAAELGRIVTIDQSSRVQTMNGLWINSYGQWGDHQALPGYAGYDYTLYGSTIGYDYTFPGKLLIGASLGMSRAEVDFGSSQGDGSVNSVTGALYGSYYAGNAYIEGTFSYGKQRYHNSRFISIGSILREASGKHDADAFTTYLGAGYNFTAGELTISPFTSLRHIHLAEEGFTETGADSLNLAVESRKTDSLVSELGISLARAFTIGKASLIPELSAALNYDFDIDDQVVTASFAGAPGNTFSIRGEEVEKYGAVIGAGLTFIHRSGVSAVLKYSGEFRERNSSHGLMGEFRYVF